MPVTIFTIGHSNLAIDAFLHLLSAHHIKALVDIRRFPGSKKHPYFGRDALAAALQKVGMEYLWLETLGGRRGKLLDQSPNNGLRNASFRNYADYMDTRDFQQGIRDLLESARKKRTAIMCAEALYWRCHRRLVSDFLVANGVTVEHIMTSGTVRRHQLTGGAVFENKRVLYPAQTSLYG